MAEFIISQVMGGIALILVVISVFLKNKTHFFLFQTIANIFYALSFIFANALVAGINTFVSIIRVLVLFLYAKYEKTPPIYLIFVFSAIYIIIGVLFYQNAYDIITIITPILFTAAMWMKNMQLVRYCMLLPNILLVLYSIMHQVYTTAILDAFETCSIVVAIISFAITNKKQRSTVEISDNSGGGEEDNKN